MGAPGGAVYMGAAYNLLATGLREALALSGRIGLSTGKTSIKDVPLLIKMLSVQTEGIAGEARKMLGVLAGRDLGPGPAPWQRWWAGRSRVLLRHETDCHDTRELFHWLKEDILTGDWPRAIESLCAELRRAAPERQQAARLARLAPVVRKAYRDAQVVGLRLGGADSGALLVDWGEMGFSFTELPIVREDGYWLFAAIPWAGERIASPPKQRTYAQWHPRHRHPRSIFSSPLRWLPGLAVLGVILVTVTLLVLGDRLPASPTLASWVPAPIAGVAGDVAGFVLSASLLLMIPGALLYVIFIRPLPNSRELRRDRRR